MKVKMFLFSLVWLFVIEKNLRRLLPSVSVSWVGFLSSLSPYVSWCWMEGLRLRWVLGRWTSSWMYHGLLNDLRLTNPIEFTVFQDPRDIIPSGCKRTPMEVLPVVKEWHFCPLFRGPKSVVLSFSLVNFGTGRLFIGKTFGSRKTRGIHKSSFLWRNGPGIDGIPFPLLYWSPGEIGRSEVAPSFSLSGVVPEPGDSKLTF